MQLSHALIGLENAVGSQIRLGTAELAEIGEQLLEVLKPAITQTLMEVVEAAADEISSQLPGQTVEVRLRDGDPELLVTDVEVAEPALPDGESLEARLTLRLPEKLKALIEDAAETSGDSINSWVVGALKSRTMSHPGTSVRTTIDL